MLNGHRDKTLSFKVEEPQTKGRTWYRIIDTARKSPQDIVTIEGAKPQATTKSIDVPPFGCIVLQSDF